MINVNGSFIHIYKHDSVFNSAISQLIALTLSIWRPEKMILTNYVDSDQTSLNGVYTVCIIYKNVCKIIK